jgi:hypothetical protein
MESVHLLTQRSKATVLHLERAFRTNTIYSRLKHTFLSCLRSDLERIGIPVKMRANGRHLRFDLGPVAVTPENVNRLMVEERRRRLNTEREFLMSLFRKGIEKHFVNGAELRMDLISPSIQFCASKADRSLFRLCMLLQGVPAQPLLYRQISALVRDEGQPGSPIIGAFGLASSVQLLACRDRFLGWHSAPKTKRKGLQRSMQLAVCVAVPPYCYRWESSRASLRLAGGLSQTRNS